MEFKECWCYNACKLNKMIISPNNKYLKCYDDKFILGRKYTDDFDVLVFAPRNIENVIIPSFIKEIASSAFQSCMCIQKVGFSNDSNLIKIDNYAFDSAVFNNIVLPSTLRFICDYAFCRCTKLKKIDFLNDSELETIGKYAFNLCSIRNFIKLRIPLNH